jgi:hypothetical protein
MTLCARECPPASIEIFVLAGVYANRQHRGFFVLAVLYAARQHRGNLFVPLASTYVFGASRCLCRPPEKYFSPFYYIIPHSHLLFLYNSHFVYYLYLAKIFAVFFNIYICRSNSPEFIIICI